jgi:hypothetical protein
MIERWFHPFDAAGCHGAGVQAYYISDERSPTGRAPGLLTFGAAHLDAVVRVLSPP